MEKTFIKNLFKSVIPSTIAPIITVSIIATLTSNQELFEAGYKYIGPSSGIGAFITVFLMSKKKSV